MVSISALYLLPAFCFIWSEFYYYVFKWQSLISELISPHILRPCPSVFPPAEGASRTDGRIHLIEKDIEHMAKGEGLVMHFNKNIYYFRWCTYFKLIRICIKKLYIFLESMLWWSRSLTFFFRVPQWCFFSF